MVASAAARRNALLNACETRASFELPEEAPVEPFDFVVANMEEPALLAAREAIVRRVRREQSAVVLAVTGFLVERAPAVSAAFEAYHLSPLRTATEGGWALIEFGK